MDQDEEGCSLLCIVTASIWYYHSTLGQNSILLFSSLITCAACCFHKTNLSMKCRVLHHYALSRLSRTFKRYWIDYSIFLFSVSLSCPPVFISSNWLGPYLLLLCPENDVLSHSKKLSRLHCPFLSTPDLAFYINGMDYTFFVW